MSVYGYIRKSYPIGTVEQMKLFVDYGCEDIFMDEYEFKRDDGFQQLLDALEDGDTVVLYNLEMLGINLNRIQQVIEEFEKKAIWLVSMNDDFDTNESMDFYHHITLFIRSIKTMRSNQTKQVVENSRRLGKDIGRPTIAKKKIDKIKNLREQQKLSYREISKRCNVSIGTVHKYAESD